jgi:hypothetical protein
VSAPAGALSLWQAEIGNRLLAGGRVGEPLATGTPAQRVGWPVTLALYRQWRVFRIRSLAPLTLARLAGHADLTVDAYLAANPGSTSYAAPDASGFLRFATAALPEDRHLDEIAFLEHALIRARRPESADAGPAPGYLGRSRRASLRVLPFPPIGLMLWLAGRCDRPHETPGGVPVLVAPSVGSWIRPATVTEARVWHWLAMDRPLRAAEGERAEPIRTLRAAGAVRHTAPATAVGSPRGNQP